MCSFVINFFSHEFLKPQLQCSIITYVHVYCTYTAPGFYIIVEHLGPYYVVVLHYVLYFT